LQNFRPHHLQSSSPVPAGPFFRNNKPPQNSVYEFEPSSRDRVCTLETPCQVTWDQDSYPFP
jgi:hypothetical protein